MNELPRYVETFLGETPDGYFLSGARTIPISRIATAADAPPRFPIPSGFEEMRALLVENRRAHEEAQAREKRHREFFLNYDQRQRVHELRLIEMEEMVRRTGYTNMIRVVA